MKIRSLIAVAPMEDVPFAVVVNARNAIVGLQHLSGLKKLLD
jgi:hypothetical protein